MVPWAHRASPQSDISVSLAVLTGITNVTNRQTNDHVTLSVATGRYRCDVT